MKKTLITLALLLPSIAFAAGLTLPQGGLGTTTVPTNWVLIGQDANRITAVATSSLGITSGSGVTGGTAGMLAAFTSATALTATGTPSAAAFYATSTTGTATTSLVDLIIRGRTAADKAEIFSAVDPLNTSIDALFITAPQATTRLYLGGRPGKIGYSVDFSYVSNILNLPNLTVNTVNTAGGNSQFTSASGGTGTRYNSYYGLEIQGNDTFGSSATTAVEAWGTATFAVRAGTLGGGVAQVIYGRIAQAGDLLQFKNSSFNKLTVVNNNGWIGIATSTPVSAMAVVGTITTNNINATTTTATSTFSGGLYVSQTSSSTVPFIYSKTAGFGGHMIIEDQGGTACTEITTKAGVVIGAVITCPTQI